MKINNKLMTTFASSVLLGSTLFAGGSIVPIAVEPIQQDMVMDLEPMFYVGIGGAITGLSKDCCTDSDTRLKDLNYGVILKAGVNVHENIALELRYINASIEKDFSSMTHYGVYLKPQFMIEQSTKIYALLGYGQTTVEYDTSTELDISAFSYGAGLEYALTQEWSAWIDMQHLLSEEGIYKTDLNLGTAGVTYNF